MLPPSALDETSLYTLGNESAKSGDGASDMDEQRYEQRYEQWAAPLRSRPGVVRALRVLNRGIVGVFYAAYAVLLLSLIHIWDSAGPLLFEWDELVYGVERVLGLALGERRLHLVEVVRLDAQGRSAVVAQGARYVLAIALRVNLGGFALHQGPTLDFQ